MMSAGSGVHAAAKAAKRDAWRPRRDDDGATVVEGTRAGAWGTITLRFAPIELTQLMCGWLEMREQRDDGPSLQDIAAGKVDIQAIEDATPWKQRWAVLDAGKLLVYDPANQMRPRFTLVIQKDMAPLCDERALPLPTLTITKPNAEEPVGYLERTAADRATFKNVELRMGSLLDLRNWRDKLTVAAMDRGVLDMLDEEEAKRILKPEDSWELGGFG